MKGWCRIMISILAACDLGGSVWAASTRTSPPLPAGHDTIAVKGRAVTPEGPRGAAESTLPELGLSPQATPLPSTPQPQPLLGLQPSVTAEAAPPPERVEVDVSTRTVAVTSVFSGTEIIIFGTVVNSRQVSAESGFYDIIVVLEGKGAPSTVRLKSNVGGLWVNTKAVRFDALPLYSALASTRPIDEISDPRLLAVLDIGFGRARMTAGRRSTTLSAEELDTYKSAAIRLKQKDGLYVRDDYSVAFIGPALFRASIKLPANIPVGPLDARVFLFREGQLLAIQPARVTVERQGLDRLLFDFAFEHPVWYGIIAVLFAASAGLVGSVLFQRQI
jgi:uncharacterized protein (TIGR02186 family)